jgi:patatin-like phospholipase/acyl hydrolase
VVANYRILSLDGGGVKGVLEARLLQRLESEAPFLSTVDLFAGTSTGGIIALALAAGVSVEDCVSLYREGAEKIFSPRDFFDRVSGGMDEYLRADYSQAGLRVLLHDVFGELRLPELGREVLLPCFDLARFRPKFLDRTDDWSCVDAALATSAAPTYLPVHVVRETLTGRATSRGSVRALVDGGVFANNPAERAIGFAQAKLHVPADEIALFSIGAGAPPMRPPAELLEEAVDVLDWGIRQWIVKKPHVLLKVLFDGSVAASHFSSRATLGERYHRIQPVLPEDVDLDDHTKVPLLLSVADAMDLEEELAWLRVHWSN